MQQKHLRLRLLLLFPLPQRGFQAGERFVQTGERGLAGGAVARGQIKMGQRGKFLLGGGGQGRSRDQGFVFARRQMRRVRHAAPQQSQRRRVSRLDARAFAVAVARAFVLAALPQQSGEEQGQAQRRQNQQ